MFDNIFAAIEKWMRELLSGMVESNLSTMFTAVNQQTSEIAAQVGQTPQGWNSSIFSMIRNISDSVVIPIAGIIITLILCYELISMLTERNNLHDVDTWMFFKYFVKMWIAVYLVSHTFDIHGLIDKMLADLRQIPTVAAAPHHNKVSVGNCPVCGNPVHESKLSFCCADRSCKFALWKESRYLSNMRKTLDKKMAVDLLKKGRTHVKDFYSAKKDKTFTADLVMRVEEGRAQYSLEFPKTPMKMKT